MWFSQTQVVIHLQVGEHEKIIPPPLERGRYTMEKPSLMVHRISSVLEKYFPPVVRKLSLKKSPLQT